MRKSWKTWVALVAFALAGQGVLALAIDEAASATPAAPQVRAVATIFPVASIVREIGGERVAVTTIVSSGVCPHEFEIAPAAAKAIDQADVVFMVARCFDGWVIPAGGIPKGPAWVEFAQAVRDSLIRIGDTFNPHFWLDPRLAGEMGKTVGRELARIDPADSAFYADRTKIFTARIDSLDAALRATLADTDAKEFVALHPAWAYFAKRYGLVEQDVLEMSPEQEPSAKWIGRVLKDMKRHSIKVVIGEEAAPQELVQMVARESGARVIVLDPLGGETKPGRNTYFALMGYNASKLGAGR
ncbi:MAG TPA: metal ABC transporter substrate-binding protein [bacterium]|nr:metal ABC transporter substrate-binding protein [bacterium]